MKKPKHKGQPMFKPRGPALPPNKKHRDRKNDYRRSHKHKNREQEAIAEAREGT